MTIQYWGDMSICVGKIELAGHGKNVDMQTTVAPLDTTPLSTTGWTTVIGGNKTGTVALQFMSDFADNSVDEVLWGYLGSSGVAKSICTPAADGSLAYLMQGVPLSYTPLEGEPGALAMGRVSGQASGSPVVRGLILHPGSTARTSSSSGTARQIGAVSATQRLYAALHVLSVSGTSPTLDVKVQSDNASNFPSATDRITFTQETAVTSNYQWSSVAGAVTDDWWRVTWTIGGSDTPTFAFLVTAGIV